MHHDPDRLSGDVAEIQGLYGAFSFPEKLLQKIWLRREFDFREARTTDGRAVRIIHPGKWNLLGGPDFRQARLQFEHGPEVVGDVELHLRAPDWDAHGHARDPAYAGVALHVVLFWPGPDCLTLGVDGRPIPILPLLPLLYHDLEEYAADEAVEVLSNRPTARLTNELAVFPPAELKTILRRQAEVRWQQKVRFAQMRIQRLGWYQACHHAALEVLGFRYNRAPMLRLASRYPLALWASGRVTEHDAFSAETETWSVQGVRPANHPRTRLRQYRAWTSACGNWPAILAEVGKLLPPISNDGSARFRSLVESPVGAAPSRPPGTGGLLEAQNTREKRRNLEFAALRDRCARDICGGAVGGTRLDNLLCDAFLPCLAATAGAAPTAMEAMRTYWFHWFCGDLPPFVTAGLRQLSVFDGREQPACHGLAQGLLGWLIEREAHRRLP